MRALTRALLLLALSAALLQAFFISRIALMAWVDPASTSFQRSEAWRIQRERGRLPWRQTWVDYSQISEHLKRAVIVSEDDSFRQHDGLDWDAMEKAWQKNARAQAQANARAVAGQAGAPGAAGAPAKAAKIVGASTITQQLAKNLLLSGERTLWRKGQELVLTYALELLLSKRRILELYLNHVEWGQGVFGAEAAAQHYFRKPAAQLSAWEAARLAVMLPRPRYYEQRPNSSYLSERAQVIVGRMAGAALP